MLNLFERGLGLGVLSYEVSSSYFEGTTCPLARFGHNRDGKKGKLQVNYGLLTDRRGCPCRPRSTREKPAIPRTLLPQLGKLRQAFRPKTVVLVGDRGMISLKAIDEPKQHEGVAWMTMLKSGRIRALVEGGPLRLGLFDEKNLFELSHLDFPGERQIACRNYLLARRAVGSAWRATRRRYLAADERAHPTPGP